MTTHRYAIVDELGDHYSATAGDYWYSADEDTAGGALVRLDHPYRTTSGRVVYAPRVVKEFPTVRDLRRIAPTLAQSRAAAGLEA